MRPFIIAKPLQAKLIANGRQALRDPEADPRPIVKLFTPDANATWLLSEIDPYDTDRAFGLCDLGLGFPELGHVSLRELAQLRGRLGLPVERDRFFHGTKPLSAYLEDAKATGRVLA